ncbi:MAG: hypothetical protein ACRD4S_13945 [Candidatus Acidiferrales bacterium]
MPKTDRFAMTSILLFVSFAVAVFSAPVPLRATGFDRFDKMQAMLQAEFVAVMVDTTQKALRDAGSTAYADQIEQLFTKVEPGDSMSLGLVELERNIARARLADVHNLEKDPKTTQRIAVEDALFVTLEKNNIKMTTPVMNAVLDAMDKFHPQTYAEFESESPTGQRRTIALLAKLGYPDWTFRDEIESRMQKKKPLFSDADLRKQMVDLTAEQFPLGSPDQPGFAPVARDIAGEYAKTPAKWGPFYNLIQYLLTQLDAQLDARDKDLTARSVVLPDGRHVYPDDSGVFWLYDNNKKAKLEDNLQPLAQRLRTCKESRGIANGEQALAACRDEVGIGDSSAQRPAPEPTRPSATRVTVTTPAPPAPSAPATETTSAPTAPKDDPIGEGGFITPPAVYNVLLCVQQPLVDKQSWNAPAGGSKMASFKLAVARYIISIAKPDWQYWIGNLQFDNFNPDASASDDTLISRASENPDPFNPSCPSGYPSYWLQVSCNRVLAGRILLLRKQWRQSRLNTDQVIGKGGSVGVGPPAAVKLHRIAKNQASCCARTGTNRGAFAVVFVREQRIVNPAIVIRTQSRIQRKLQRLEP